MTNQPKDLKPKGKSAKQVLDKWYLEYKNFSNPDDGFPEECYLSALTDFAKQEVERAVREKEEELDSYRSLLDDAVKELESKDREIEAYKTACINTTGHDLLDLKSQLESQRLLTEKLAEGVTKVLEGVFMNDAIPTGIRKDIQELLSPPLNEYNNSIGKI